MARHLCIVARENSPLYGYLTIAFRDRPPGVPTLDIVLDRRHAEAHGESNGDVRSGAAGQDRRRHAALDEAVRSRGYAIFTGPGGGAPSRQDEVFIERAIGLLADVERRGPLALRFGARRRGLLIGLAKGAAGVAVVVLLLVGVMRLGGISRIAEGAAEWADATVQRLEEAWIVFRGQEAAPPEPRSEREAAPATASSAPSSSLPVEGPAAAASAPAVVPAPAAPAPPTHPVMLPPASARPAPEPPRPAVRAPIPVTPPPPRAAVIDTPRPSAPPVSREPAVPTDHSLPSFSGLLPRVDMSRQASPSGSGVVYSVRMADSGGRAIAGAHVWLRGQGVDGQMRETRLEDTERPGVYKSGVLPPELMPPSGLSVRVFFSNMRIEIPIDG